MACGGCGKKTKTWDVWLEIDNSEFFLGAVPLGTYLMGIADNYEEGRTYKIRQFNKTSNAQFSGTLVFEDGKPLVNGRRLIV